MFTWTDDPITEIWHQIRYLRSPKNISNLLSGRTKSGRTSVAPEGEDLTRRSEEIASCIKQADEYYIAAGAVSLATHPLLEFYGAHALAKATVLASDTNRWLTDIKYHGLSTRADHVADTTLRERLRAYSTSASAWAIEDEFAITNDGLFPGLCRAVGQTPLGSGQVTMFKDILALMPETEEMYERHYQQKCRTERLYVDPKKSEDGFLEVFFGERDLASLQRVYGLFPELRNWTQTNLHSFLGFRAPSPETELSSIGVVRNGAIAGKYLLRPLQNGLHDGYCTLFSGLFILSNIVRYKPDFWMKSIEGRASGSVGLVSLFCNVARRQLPARFLESIWQEPFTFGSPGYLS